MKKIIILYIPILFTTGCAYNNINVYDTIDEKNKTISVDVSTAGSLAGKLSQVLRRNGFTVYVKNKITDSGYITTKSQYELFVTADKTDVCFVGGIKYSFGISMVDLSNSQEVINFSGLRCEDNIVSKFEEIIQTK